MHIFTPKTLVLVLACGIVAEILCFWGTSCSASSTVYRLIVWFHQPAEDLALFFVPDLDTGVASDSEVGVGVAVLLFTALFQRLAIFFVAIGFFRYLVLRRYEPKVAA